MLTDYQTAFNAIDSGLINKSLPTIFMKTFS